MNETKVPAPTTVSLADEEGVKQILVDTLFGLWATINNLTRLRVTADFTIPQCVDTADEIIALVRARHAVWTATQARP